MDLNLLPYTDFSIALRMLDAFSRGVNISKKKKKEKERNSKSHFPKILKNHSPPDKGAFFFFARIFVLRMDRSIQKHARNDGRGSVGRHQLNRRDNGHWSPVIARYYA